LVHAQRVKRRAVQQQWYYAQQMIMGIPKAATLAFAALAAAAAIALPATARAGHFFRVSRDSYDLG
jgi:hypothetical protein